MFVTEEQRLSVGFDVALARLASFVRDASVVSASRQAYAGLASVVPAASAPAGLNGTAVLDGTGGRTRTYPALAGPRLVRVAFRDLVTRGSSAVLVLRWEAAEPGGTVFPVLDADLTLTASGRTASMLTLNGAWRPPAAGGGLDRADLHRVATAAVRGFVSLVADGICCPGDRPLS